MAARRKGRIKKAVQGRSWKTTLLGLGSILLGAGALVADPQAALENSQATLAPIIAGLGLLFARDGKPLAKEQDEK